MKATKLISATLHPAGVSALTALTSLDHEAGRRMDLAAVRRDGRPAEKLNHQRALEVGGKVLYVVTLEMICGTTGAPSMTFTKNWLVVAVSPADAISMVRDAGLAKKKDPLMARMMKVLQPRYWSTDGIPCLACVTGGVVIPASVLDNRKSKKVSRRVL